MMKFYKLFSIFIVLLLAGCSLDWDKIMSEPNLPYWSTKLEFPILSTEVTLETLAEDSAITIEGLDSFYVDGQSQDSLFVFRKTIEINKIEVGNKLKIDPISTSISQNVDDVTIDPISTSISENVDDVIVAAVSKNISTAIGTISLDNIDPAPTAPYTLESIHPGMAALHGTTAPTIDGFDLQPVKSPFQFDDFDDAVFSNGQLLITIQNELSIPLGDIKILLFKTNGSFIGGSQVNIYGPIPKGTSKSETLELNLLASPLPGEIDVMVKGNSPGGTNVEIDKGSFFKVLISGSDLEIESARAKVPEQIIQEGGNIALEPDSNKVIEATIQSGNLIIEVDNYMALESDLEISIPSILSPSGNKFVTSFPILSNAENIEDQTDMTGYILEMTADSQIINYNYTVRTVDSKFDQNLVTDMVLINAEDSIVVSIKLEGSVPGADITFSQFSGYLNQEAMVDSNSIELDNEGTKVNEATLKSGSMVLSITNGLGIAADVDFTIEEFIKNGSSLDTSFSLNTDPAPLDIIIDLSGYDLSLDVNENPQKVNYVSTIDIPSDEVVSLTFGQSIDIDVLIDTLSFQNFSGFLDQDAMVDSSTIELDNDTKVDKATLESGKMILTITNEVGIAANVDFTIEEFIKNGSSLDTSFSLNTDPSPLDIIIDLSGYDLNLDVDEDTQKVHYASTINIPSDEEVSLTFGQSIAIDVLIDTLLFQEITGYIDPVIVDIDPVEEAIELPEQLEDFQFDQVEMKLDFQSSISLPVFLNLSLTAFNDETGDSVIKVIDRHNITETPIVYIDSAQQLINILPNRITASGQAEVGDLNELGAVASTDTLSGLLTVAAPLSFIISDSSIITIDPQKLDTIDIDGLQNAKLFIDYQNEFEFGSSITVLLATDTTSFDSGEADTLISLLQLGANVSGRDSITLVKSDFDLLNRQGNYSKAIISLLGRANGPSRFLSTDTLKINLSASFEYLINQPESTESSDE